MKQYMQSRQLIPSVIGSKTLITPHVLTEVKGTTGAMTVKFGTMKGNPKYDISFNTGLNTGEPVITEIGLNFDVKGTYVQVDITSLDCPKIAKFTYVGPITLCILSTSTITVGITIPSKQRNVRVGINQITTMSIGYNDILQYIGECASSNILLVASLVERLSLRSDIIRTHTYFMDYAMYNLFMGRPLPSMEYYNGGVARNDNPQTQLTNAEELSRSIALKQEELLRIEQALGNRDRVLSFAGQDKLRFLEELRDSLEKELEFVDSLIKEYAVSEDKSDELPTESNLHKVAAEIEQIKTQLCNHVRTIAYKLITR